MSSRWPRVAVAVSAALALAACERKPPPVPVAEAPPPPPMPGAGIGIYMLGPPYTLDGVWYYPSEDPSYNVAGVAAVYPADADKRFTANGEAFDQRALAGASRTLPLPSIVEVTDLENGRSIQVRVNDRGPPHGDRVIELTRRAALFLDFRGRDAAKVRVRMLLNPSIAAASAARANGEAGDDPASAELPRAAPVGAVETQALAPIGHPAAPQRVSPALAATGVSANAPRHYFPPVPALPETVTQTGVGPAPLYVRAGSYPRAGRAYELAHLLGAYARASVDRLRAGGMVVYRLRLGPVETIDAADRLRERAIEAGAAEAHIAIE